ncbi:hypothetical protein SUGI_0814290 [Cryptomeria japonica]|nr:hypothetical protein SUGI_0814290 [Cryptomeria japonica]
MQIKYRLTNYLGSGAYGTVAKALDFKWGNTVAVKTSSCIDVAFQESEILNFFISQSICGADSRMGNNGPELVKGLMWELCCGVAYCHDMGVAHRDLKPSNCLLSISKEGAIKIKLADFGLATMVKDKRNGLMERNGKEYGTLWYRAPELLMQQQKTYNCFAIDVWALGCIFAEMVIGEPIFCGQCLEE